MEHYDEDGICLEKCEIRQDLLKEYLYLLCEIKVNGEHIAIQDLFDKPADFVILLVNKYEKEAGDIVEDIINDTLAEFDSYFKE